MEIPASLLEAMQTLRLYTNYHSVYGKERINRIGNEGSDCWMSVEVKQQTVALYGFRFWISVWLGKNGRMAMTIITHLLNSCHQDFKTIFMTYFHRYLYCRGTLN
jgi:hypothetical protein